MTNDKFTPCHFRAVGLDYTGTDSTNLNLIVYIVRPETKPFENPKGTTTWVHECENVLLPLPLLLLLFVTKGKTKSLKGGRIG